MVASLAAYSISPSPVPGRPSLVGVAHTGPTLIWSGRSAPAAAQAASTCSRRMGREPDQCLGPRQLTCLRHRHVLLTHVDAVRSAGGDQVRPVVEDEQRLVLGGRAAEGVGESDQLLGAARGLLPQLDDVRAPSEGSVEQRTGLAASRKAVANEVEARRLQRARAADRGRWPSISVSRSHGSTMKRQREPREPGLRGRHPGRRPSEPDPGNAGAGMVARNARRI